MSLLFFSLIHASDESAFFAAGMGFSFNRDKASESVIRTRGAQAATVRCILKEISGILSSSEDRAST